MRQIVPKLDISDAYRLLVECVIYNIVLVGTEKVIFDTKKNLR